MRVVTKRTMTVLLAVIMLMTADFSTVWAAEAEDGIVPPSGAEKQQENSVPAENADGEDSYFEQSWNNWEDWNDWEEMKKYLEGGGVASDSFQEELALLRAAGIIEGALQLDQPVTRGKMCAALTAVHGLDPNAAASFSPNPFSDVTPETEYYNAVLTAVGQGYINGFTDGTFRPDMTLTVEQAIKMMVTVLGFNVPGMFDIDQYQTIPCTRNIIQNVKLGMQDTLDGSAFITLLFNTLNEPMNYQTTFGDKKEYQKDEALTLLSVYHQVYEIQAIAEADAYTSISGGAKAPEGKILLGGGIYEMGDSGADSLLGQNVRAYVKDTDQEKRVLSAFPYRSVNMKFTPDQLDPETTAERICFTDEKTGKQKSIKLDAHVSVIVNGQYALNFAGETFRPSSGHINAIDNDKDGIYEVVFVYRCTDYVVTSASSVNYTVGTKYQKESLKLVPEEHDLIRYTMDGGKAGFNNIGENDTLSVAASPDNSLIYVFISKQSLSGAASTVYDEGGEMYISVGEEKHRVAPQFRERLRRSAQSLVPGLDPPYDDSWQNGVSRVLPLTAGTEGTFHLNYNGEIAGITYTNVSGMRFGYLQKVGRKSGFEEGILFRIFTQEGAFVEYTSGKQLTVDGTPYGTDVQDRYEKVYKALTVPDENKPKTYKGVTPMDQLILYRSNGKGEVLEIDTEYYNENTETHNDMGVVTSNRDRTYVTSILDGKKYDEFFIMPADCKVFEIPGDIDSEQDYKVAAHSVLNGRPTLYGYGVENCLAKAVVHPTGGGGGSVGEVAYFVTNIADVIVTDSNGDMVETKAVYIADGGEEKELVVRPESVKYVFDEKQVKIGDAIRYGESSGYLVSVDKPIAWQDTVDAEGNPIDQFNRTMGNDYHYDYRFVYGAVDEIVNNKFGSVKVWTQGTPEAPANPEWHTLATLTWYVEYSRSAGTAKIIKEPIDPEQLLVSKYPNARIFLYTRYTETRMAMVIVD